MQTPPDLPRAPCPSTAAPVLSGNTGAVSIETDSGTANSVHASSSDGDRALVKPHDLASAVCMDASRFWKITIGAVRIKYHLARSFATGRRRAIGRPSRWPHEKVPGCLRIFKMRTARASPREQVRPSGWAHRDAPRPPDAAANLCHGSPCVPHTHASGTRMPEVQNSER